MTPTPEHVEGWEAAMEYMTLMAAENHVEANDVITRVFSNFDVALGFAVALGNFANALVHSTAGTFKMTPSEVWVHCATRLQAHRPPEWER